MRKDRIREDNLQDYRRYMTKKKLVLLALVFLLLLCFLTSITTGSSGMTYSDVLQAILHKATKQMNTIVWNVRMPRAAVGICVGMALSISACIMQNILRNPLASASTLGVSQGASFGAALAICVFGAGVQVNAGGISSALTITNPLTVTVCAFIGGMCTTIVLMLLARVFHIEPSTMILAGVAISSLFTGATTLVQYFADDVMVATVVYWTFGSLGRAGWREIHILFALTLLAFGYFMWNRWNYNAMESGAHTAKSLGVHTDRLTIVSLSLCALISSVSVAFVGCISFIGLIAPHIVRRFTGNDYRYLIPGSALLGGILMLLADIASRVLVAPTVLPIGALTSFLGAPIFLYMILHRRKTA